MEKTIKKMETIGNKREFKSITKGEEQSFDMDTLNAICYKALKVVYASSRGCNKYVAYILEHYKNNAEFIFADLENECFLKMAETGYYYNNILNINGHKFKTVKTFKNVVVVDKKAVYRYIQRCLYKYQKDNDFNVEIVINADLSSNTDDLAYLNYVTKTDKTTKKLRIELDSLNLTERQKEVLEIYTKTCSYLKTAEMLGVSKTAIVQAISKIRNKVAEYNNINV